MSELSELYKQFLFFFHGTVMTWSLLCVKSSANVHNCLQLCRCKTNIHRFQLQLYSSEEHRVVCLSVCNCRREQWAPNVPWTFALAICRLYGILRILWVPTCPSEHTTHVPGTVWFHTDTTLTRLHVHAFCIVISWCPVWWLTYKFSSLVGLCRVEPWLSDE